MRIAIGLLLVLASFCALAQQAPGVITQPPPPVPPPPAEVPSAQIQVDNEELLQLLRTQTAAIKALSIRLDGIEQRLQKIEQRARP